LKAYCYSEEDLRNHFISKHEETVDTELFVEVPVFCRSVDLVIKSMKGTEITAIEFKLNDWKRALFQAQSVSLCFDFLYICVPKPKTQKGYETVVAACKSNNVGLYFFDDATNSFEKTVNGPKVDTVWNSMRFSVIDYLEAKKYEGCTQVT
jgi:hypothetical protein